MHAAKLSPQLHKGTDFTGVTIVFFCHDGKGNYLLNKRSTNCRDEHGRWDPGAGSLEMHDTVEATLHREISEEYCTQVIDYEFLGFRDMHREHEGQKTHWIALDFKVLVDREQVKIGEPHKHEAIGWFTLGNLPQPLHSQFLSTIEKYKGKL